MDQRRTIVLVGIVIVAAAFRLLPHPPNVTLIGALALFGGAVFADKRAAFLVPVTALLLSDFAVGLISGNLSLGLHRLLPVVYGSFALMVCLGFWLRRRRRVLPIAGATVTGSMVFFVLTNVGVWAVADLYLKSWDGLIACSVAAMAFFHHTVLGDARYVSLLFGGLALVERGWPLVRGPELSSAR
ncbi:MAG: hypothetical protein NNA25_03290 [Nitrospira sp.]|nr:hypothetical protein [Nitrospira sp.]